MRAIPGGAPILTAEAMRGAEAACFAGGVSQVALMERASAAVAREAARFAVGRPILVLAGPGNNGGDAWGAAAMLAAAGHDVMVAALGEPREGAAAAMRARYAGEVAAIDAAAERPVVVDGLFGIGDVRPFAAEVRGGVERLCREAFVLAIDVPSGLDADRGEAVEGTPRANVTLALGALKPGHVAGRDPAHCGHVLLADIGIDTGSTARTIARPRLSAPDEAAHKYTRGLVLVIAGAMAGAARLAARGAAEGGAGYVVLASDDARVPHDAVVHVGRDRVGNQLEDERTGAVVLGPGLGRDDEARSLCEQVLASDCAVVLDGDALALVDAAWLASRRAPTILTPHDGEFARLFGDGHDRLTATRRAAEASGCVVVRKGAATVIADPGGETVVATPPSWLSTAGTGDVLAGVTAARLASGAAPMRAACEAVWLHGEAARLAGPAFVADALAMHLPAAIRLCL